jgi:hypothetical protein
VYISYVDGLNSSGTGYINPEGVSISVEPNQADGEVAADSGCTIGSLRVVISSAPGALANRTFTVLEDGVPTNLTCGITGPTNRECSPVGTDIIDATDLITVQSSVGANAASAANAHISFTCK